MRRFVANNPPRHIATWEDFEGSVGYVTGKNYGWFFDQWTRREGLPDFALMEARWDRGRAAGSVAFKGKPYRFHADVLMRFADGRSRYGRVEILPDSSGKAEFSLPCRERPASLTLDPWQTIPRVGSARERTTGIAAFIASAKVVQLSGPKVEFASIPSTETLDRIPADPSGKLLLGTVESLRPLLDRSGLTVAGDRISFDGTPIDLAHGGVIALAEFPDGKRCAVGLGRCKTWLSVGKASLSVFDENGRLLRAKTPIADRGTLTRTVAP